MDTSEPLPPTPANIPSDGARRGFSLSLAQVLAGVLSAITVAFTISKLGFTGTLIGAGIGSVIGTFGSALYKNSLDKSQAAVAKILTKQVDEAKPGDVETEGTKALVLGSAESEDTSNADTLLQGDKLVWWKQVEWKPMLTAAVLAMAVAVSTLSFLEARIPSPNQGMTVIYEAQEEVDDEEVEEQPTIVYIQRPTLVGDVDGATEQDIVPMPSVPEESTKTQETQGSEQQGTRRQDSGTEEPEEFSPAEPDHESTESSPSPSPESDPSKEESNDADDAAKDETESEEALDEDKDSPSENSGSSEQDQESKAHSSSAD